MNNFLAAIRAIPPIGKDDLMKKIISLILSAFLCLHICAVSASAEEEMIRSWHICKTVETAYISGILSTAILETATVKDQTVAIGRNESLIVRKNVTLVLKRGARIDGTIYIHKGGKLRITGGALSVSPSGAIISDGMLSIGKKAEFTVENGGEVFVGKTGRLFITDEESLQFGDMSTVVCAGKTNAKNEKIGKKLIAAYVTKDGETTLSENPESELPTAGYFPNYDPLRRKNILYVFENGIVFRAKSGSDHFEFIGKTQVHPAVGYTFNDQYLKIPELNPGKGLKFGLVKIVEIDGEDFRQGYDGCAPVLILPISSELVDS